MSWASAAAATAAPAPTSAAPIATAAPAAPAEPLPPPLREGETNWSLFVKGVHYAIDLWTIIELALAHGFGGKNTPQKVQTLEFELLDMFSSKRKKVADLDEVEDFLYEFLGDKLRVEAEDGSVEEVSDILIDLYDSIYKDANIAPFEKLEKDWMAKQAKIAKTERPRRERSSSSTSSSSAAGTTPTPTQEVEMTEASAPESKVDADGWETVNHKKKRR